MGGIYRGEPSFLNAKKRELAARPAARVLRLSCAPSPITIRKRFPGLGQIDRDLVV
jgi:hypothetical protein